MNPQLVLSLFPGIGLLDMAFEEEGFTVVRGPDLLWGGDVRRFSPPRGRFNGLIGGPPCQAHSTYANINRSIGNKVAEDLVPEFIRVVAEADPDWWVMENVPAVPRVSVTGYTVRSLRLDARWFGLEQSRKRVFQYGSKRGIKLDVGPFLSVLEHPNREPTCLASEGGSGKISNKKLPHGQRSTYRPRRSFDRFCELQGLPRNFLEDAPFTVDGKYTAVGNGVPLPMGRAIARAVKSALEAT